MKIVKIVVGKDDDIFGLGDDNLMYIWNQYSASWDLISVKKP
ncbi:MAG: hypothetical protein WAN50_04735 [Minisyncoccia bacterium]